MLTDNLDRFLVAYNKRLISTIIPALDLFLAVFTLLSFKQFRIKKWSIVPAQYHTLSKIE